MDDKADLCIYDFDYNYVLLKYWTLSFPVVYKTIYMYLYHKLNIFELIIYLVESNYYSVVLKLANIILYNKFIENLYFEMAS